MYRQVLLDTGSLVALLNRQYQSVNEAINAGLKLLMEQELIYQGRFAELRQEIMVGIEASQRGEVVDSETVFNSIQEKLEQRRHQAES
ncbi:hypothetical protein [Pleurocapsa sp. FMAR1]|uniref:hypothetical protein n=1 Tax=Pleurocapsa sp. FMAR1 TaxID=3040204 RepID=UPI0029C7ADCC|nr:hypothetical protein [Pleurocapsa sp. FMAR1]